MAAGGLIGIGARRVAASLLLLAAVAGCTDDDGGPDRSTTSMEIPDEPVDGGRVRLGLPGPLVLDPLAASAGSPAELMVAELLHDGLTALGPDGEVLPGLARSWTAEDSFQTWTVRLDAAASFTDGDPVTAEAVVTSLTRVAAAGPGSLASLRLEAVAGYDELVAGEADGLAGLSVEDDVTLRIQTTSPLATLPAVLAAPELGIVDPSNVEVLEAVEELGEVDPDELALSGRWAPEAVDGGALTVARRTGADGHLDEVVLEPFDDPADAYEAFEDGAVDWALVPGSAYDDAIEAHGDEHVAPFHAEVFLGLRVAGPPLDAGPLRTAIAAAIDREALVADVYADVADPLATVVPAGVPGHDPDACGDAVACEHDPEAAEAALAEAYPDGDVPTVAIDFDDSDRQTRLAERVADDLDAVGIPTQLRPRPRDEYRAFVSSGGQQLFSLGWIGGYVSPDAYLAPLFGSVADDNLTGASSPPIDEALAAARATDDASAAEAAWRRAEQQILSTAVVVPLAQFRTQAVAADRVQDLAHRVDGTVDWAAVWVADAAGDG
jgi:ABC-type transport system substrate-binding protein